MSDSEPPPPSSGPTPGSEPPPSPRSKDSRRRRLEGVIPEIVKRAVELGIDKARESPENLKQFVQDLKVPKEIAHYLLGQVDETKNGLFRVVAKEMRDFLEQTNFAGEMQKLLTTVQFEVNTTIRFTPNDQKKKKKKDEKDQGQAEDDPAEEPSEEELEDGDESEPEVAAADDDRAQQLPRPEVKTQVHVRRDGEKRRRPKTS
jgi:hypothetical protein